MQKKNFNHYTLILLLLFFFISCKEVFVKGNFVVTAPGGWQRKDTVSKDGCKKVQFFKLTPDTSLTWHENISIAVVHSKDLDRYAGDVLTLTKKDAIFFQERGRGDTLLNGYKAKWAAITVLHANAADDEKKEQRIYFVKGEVHNNIYMIIGTSHKDGFAAIQDALDTVLHSFRVINETSKPG